MSGRSMREEGMFVPRLGLVLGMGVVAAGALGLSAASAQYPAPLGLCVVTSPGSSLNANSTVTYTISATTTDGKGAPNVAGTVRIGEQPGGATVGTGTFTTDANGRASVTVTTGANAGNLQVMATVGTLNCANVSSVVAQKTNPDVIKPPDTGTGVAQDGGSALVPALGAAAVAVAGAGAATVAVRRKRS